MEIDLTEEGFAKGNPYALTVDDKLAAAREHLRVRDFRTAFARIGEAMLAAPTRLDVLSTYADIVSARGNFPVAVGIAEAALAHNPDSPDAKLGLAEKQLQAGRQEDALATVGRACEDHPEHLDVLVVRADLLWRAGRTGESLAAYRAAARTGRMQEHTALTAASRALESGYPAEARAITAAARRLHPGSPRLAVLQGEAALADGKPAEALTAVASVTDAGGKASDIACVRARSEIDQARPHRALTTLAATGRSGERAADAAVLRAVALRFSGDAPGAKRAYAEALQHAPEVPRLHLGYALCLAEFGLPGEAVRALDRGLSRNGANPGLLRERARLLTRLGEHAAARESARHATASTGAAAADVMEGPALLDGGLEPELGAAEVETVLEQGSLSTDERTGFLFLLGSLHAASDAPQVAMAVWHAANARVRRTFAFDVDALTAQLQRLPEVCAAWRTGPVANALPPRPLPVFIVGMPRSGTSLVEHILAAHSAVRPGGEDTTIPDLLGDLRRCFPDAGYPDGLRHLGREELGDLRRHILTRLAARYPGARVVTDKLPGNFAHLGLLHRLFPEAPIVVCRRHPLDTALSIYTQWFSDHHPYAYDLGEIGRVNRACSAVLDAWHAQRPGTRMHTVRYEDLVRAPTREIERLLAACGLAPEAACFRPWHEPRHMNSGGARRLDQPITDARVNRWKVFAKALAPAAAGEAADQAAR